MWKHRENVETSCKCGKINLATGPSTKDVRQMGRGGGGFEISDIPGRGEGGGL